MSELIKKLEAAASQMQMGVHSPAHIAAIREAVGALSKKPDYSAALDIAAKWLEQAGACTHYPGYTCDKDFSTEGTCAKCLRAHFLKLAREKKKEET